MITFLLGVSICINIVLAIILKITFKTRDAISEIQDVIEDKDVYRDFFFK